MKEAYRPLDIRTLKEGAVIERINAEMEKVSANVRDINTDPHAAREVVIKLKLIPTEDRQSMGVVVSCASKLVSGEKIHGRVYFDENGSAVEPKEAKEVSLFDAALSTTEDQELAVVSVGNGKTKKMKTI